MCAVTVCTLCTVTVFVVCAVAGGGTLAEHLVARGIYCTHGNHYAPVLVEDELQRPEGVTRVSFMHYNTLEEVDRVVQALEDILSAP